MGNGRGRRILRMQGEKRVRGEGKIKMRHGGRRMRRKQRDGRHRERGDKEREWKGEKNIRNARGMEGIERREIKRGNK